MQFRSLPILLISSALALAGIANGQSPESPGESVLRDLPTVSTTAADERFVHRSGWYGDAGVLVAPPMLYSAKSHGQSWNDGVLPPVPAPFGTLGFRRANDTSWQASLLVVPLVDPRQSVFDQPMYLATTGLDIDRISTNRSPWASVDLRWQVGLRTVGIGINGIPVPVAMGPHAGLRLEYPLAGNLFLNGWADVGVLPSIFNGIPMLDLRNELGLTWRSQRHPGFATSVSLFNEVAGVVVAGFITPGIKARLVWNF